MTLKQKYFYDIEDSLLSIECGDCGAMYEGSDIKEIEDGDTCESCGSDNLLQSTCHEGVECGLCSHTFDMWEDGYYWSGSGAVPKELKGEIICKDCYNEL